MPASALVSLGFICIGLSTLLLPMVSPEDSVQGLVVDFHKAGNKGSNFQFRVRVDHTVGPPLNFSSSDMAFYKGDPPLRDGDVVQLSFDRWSHEVVAMRELHGQHVGWWYDRQRGALFSLFISVLGVCGFVWTLARARRVLNQRALTGELIDRR